MSPASKPAAQDASRHCKRMHIIMATAFADDRIGRQAITDAEWQVRIDLAAFYRIAALYHFDDFLYTHISARVPGPITTS
jgi:hypothetical protein